MGEPTGLEPWALFGESAGATAYALHGSGDGRLRPVRGAARQGASRVLDPDRPHMDYPVAGLVLYGLGVWGLLKDGMPVEDAVRLLVLAEQFAYARYTRRMDPAHTVEAAERRAPGLAAPAARGVRRAQGPGPPAGGPGRRGADRHRSE